MKCTHPIAVPLRGNALKNFIKYNNVPLSLAQEYLYREKSGQFKLLPREYQPCGRCLYCRRSMQNAWVFRNIIEYTKYPNAYFLTLTYDQDHIDPSGSLIKDHVQKIFKRMRYDGAHFSYFYCGEYGRKTLRPHYHMLWYNHDEEVFRQHEVYRLIVRYWDYGQIFIGSVSPASIMYCTKYILKDSKVPPGCLPPYADCSKRPAIGSSFFGSDHARFLKDNLRTASALPFNFLGSIPRYYRDRIFSEEEKYKLYCKQHDEKDLLAEYHRDHLLETMEEIYFFKLNLYDKSVI